jgi:hypothetical protein
MILEWQYDLERPIANNRINKATELIFIFAWPFIHSKYIIFVFR